MRPNIVSIIAFILVVVGAINWGLVGAFDFNLVAALLGDMTIASRVVYVLVGLAGIYMLIVRPGLSGHRADATHDTTRTNR